VRDLDQQLDDVVERGGVEAGERFVHQQELLLPHQLLGDRDALALAARDLGGEEVGALVEAEAFEQGLRLRLASSRGRPLAIPATIMLPSTV
jgi:hypothetical protein